MSTPICDVCGWNPYTREKHNCIAKLQADLAAAEARAEKAEDEQRVIQAQADAMENGMDMWADRAEAAERERDEARAALATMAPMEPDLHAEARALKAEVSALRTEIDDNHKRIADLSARRYLHRRALIEFRAAELAGDEVERERMRVVACGVAAMSDTPTSAAEQRIDRSNEYWTAAYESVCRRVDECIALRAEVEALTRLNDSGCEMLVKAEAEVETHRNDADNLREEVKDLRAEVERLTAAIRESDKYKTHLANRVDSMQDQLAALTAKLEAARAIAAEARAGIVTESQTRAFLQRKLDRITAALTDAPPAKGCDACQPPFDGTYCGCYDTPPVHQGEATATGVSATIQNPALPLLDRITGRELLELQKSFRETWDRPACKRTGVCCYKTALATAECVFCGEAKG